VGRRWTRRGLAPTASRAGDGAARLLTWEGDSDGLSFDSSIVVAVIAIVEDV
jgi:hypothetical protein